MYQNNKTHEEKANNKDCHENNIEFNWEVIKTFYRAMIYYY